MLRETVACWDRGSRRCAQGSRHGIGPGHLHSNDRSFVVFGKTSFDMLNSHMGPLEAWLHLVSSVPACLVHFY